MYIAATVAKLVSEGCLPNDKTILDELDEVFGNSRIAGGNDALVDHHVPSQVVLSSDAGLVFQSSSIVGRFTRLSLPTQEALEEAIRKVFDMNPTLDEMRIEFDQGETGIYELCIRKAGEVLVFHLSGRLLRKWKK